MAPPYRISPSQAARYYFLECERYLRYTSTPAADRPGEGIPALSAEERPATTAILEGGYEWEERVVTSLGERVHVAEAPEKQLRDRILTVEETERAIRAVKPGEHIYQASLESPGRLYERFGLDRSFVSFSVCRPDLIECVEIEGRRVLRIIDVKATPGLKLSHRVQTTLYCLILESLVDEWGLDITIDHQAGVWLSEAKGPELFDTRTMRPPIEAFLAEDLVPILRENAGDARWHVYFRCEWCEYFEPCRAQMQAEDSVSRLPYLGVHSRRFLGQLDPPANTLAALDEALADPVRTAQLEQSAMLRGRTHRIREQVRALRDGSVRVLGGASIGMPRRENCRVVFTLQTEPVNGQLYAFAIYVQGFQEVLGGKSAPWVRVAATRDPAEIEDIERSFVRELCRILGSLHDFNVEHAAEWERQKTLQIYTFDSYEHELLIELLGRRLLDPEGAAEALQLFFYFQRPELAQAPRHPSHEVFFPVVVLTRVLRELLALPVEVTYRFADVVQLIRSSSYAFEYRADPYFAFEFSNQLRSDAIYAVWDDGRTELLPRIEFELRARVWGASGIVNGIRECLDKTDALFAYPPRFRLPQVQALHSPTLSRLAFIARYEAAVQYLETRERRAARREEKLESGAAFGLVSMGSGSYRVDERHRRHVLTAGDFGDWLLVPDNPEGWRASLAFDDFRLRATGAPPRELPLAVAKVLEVRGSLAEPNQEVTLELSPSRAFVPPTPGEPFLLEPRFTDRNTDTILTELQAIDADPAQDVTGLLEDAGAWNGAMRLPEALADAAMSCGRALGMTPSQLEAFDRILRNRLQLVWGPPGTGKTYFLALALLSLAEAHRKHSMPFRAILTAFTHAAIENALAKLADVQARHAGVLGGCAIAKANRLKDAALWNVQSVPDRSAADWLERNPVCILGGTVWALRKQVYAGAVDAVIIDEGSQMRVPEAAIAARRLRRGGWLIVAGDHRQLPPIVQGVYPEPAAGEPLLHRSIFESLQAQGASNAYTSILLENFRMNRTLTRYPAEQIYVPGYQPVDDRVGARLLAVEPGGCDALTAEAIDPDYPLVVVVTDGVRAAAENRVEAALVARVALELRARLRDSAGDLYPEGAAGDGRFWRDGLFIVSPHHAQINAVQLALAAGRTWGVKPFVGTVDKMQGQECDAVITSYGVADIEYAAEEKDFIYSLNRLNVAVTRGRAKTIVFLSRALLEPPLASYEEDATAEGISFMQGLVQFARHHGETSTHPLEGGASATIYRVGLL